MGLGLCKRDLFKSDFLIDLSSIPNATKTRLTNWNIKILLEYKETAQNVRTSLAIVFHNRCLVGVSKETLFAA